MTFKLPDFFLFSSVKRNRTHSYGRVILSTFKDCHLKQNISFDGHSLEIKFHTQKAKLNYLGRLVL